jgi:putative nucleotidyltransferase with HDIG domain
MLKKIPIGHLRLGMHVHSLGGAWLDHPFWKTRFLLDDASDLAKLRASSVPDCTIDTAKGLDVAVVADLPSPRRDAAPRAIAGPSAANAPAFAIPPSPTPTRTLQDELKHAAQLVNRSREAVVSMFNEARMGRALQAEQCLPLVSDIADSVQRNPDAFVSLARLKTHDDYTYMHSVAVCALMVALARRLGFDAAQAREAGLAGLLHDLGKAMMPLDVLNKPAQLSEDEYRTMKSHPERGHELLLQGGGAAGPVALDVCLHHHERPDGKGYPHGLSGDALSLHARMGAVCDVYDAITSNRPYKGAWGPADSIARMADWRRQGQFDPEVFKVFVQSLGIYPTGSLVRMRSGRLGVVLEQHATSMTTPRVRLFFSTRSELPIPLEDLDLAASGCSDAIEARESNQRWQFKHLDELWAGPEAGRRLGP